MRLSAGNQSERHYLLPLVDGLLERGITPAELWADRGYDSGELERELRARGLEPQISKRRRPGQPVEPGNLIGEVWRGRRRSAKTRDPHAPQRWPVERTNAWLKARRRVATRRDRKPDNYLAFVQLAMALILIRSF